MAVREEIEYKQQGSNLVIPALIIVLATLAFALGALWQRVEYLQKGTTATTTGAAAQPSQPAAQPPADPTQAVKADTLNLDPVTDKDHMQGNKNAQLTLIEYSDLQCPFCKQFHPTLEQVMKDYDGKVRWVYRHFPLESIHPVALKDSIGAECAAELGGADAFWKYVNANFASDLQVLSPAKLTDFAQVAGVNAGAFKTCLDGDKTLQKVKDQQASGAKAGVQGTPNTFVLDKKGNAWVIGGALPITSVKQIIDKALSS